MLKDRSLDKFLKKTEGTEKGHRWVLVPNSRYGYWIRCEWHSTLVARLEVSDAARPQTPSEHGLHNLSCVQVHAKYSYEPLLVNKPAHLEVTLRLLYKNVWSSHNSVAYQMSPWWGD